MRTVAGPTDTTNIITRVTTAGTTTIITTTTAGITATLAGATMATRVFTHGPGLSSPLAMGTPGVATTMGHADSATITAAPELSFTEPARLAGNAVQTAECHFQSNKL